MLAHNLMDDLLMTVRQTQDADLRNTIEHSDWNFAESDTREFTHGIHRYSGKFIPQIARQAIELLTAEGEVVLDPFCGSGTTILEAALVSRRAIGVDLNPLAVLIARVKCTPIAERSRNELLYFFRDGVESLEETKCLSLFKSDDSSGHRVLDECNGDPRLHDPWFLKWFDTDGLLRLVWIHRMIQEISSSACRDLAMVAFSDIVRRCSHAAGGYPNVMYDKSRRSRPDPVPLFLRRLEEIVGSVATLDGTHCDELVKIRHLPAQATELEDESVDAIVTHPPYIGSIPYAEYGAISLKWLGYDPKVIDKKLTGGQRQSANVLSRFRLAFGEMLVESYRVLKPGRHIFLMVGHPLVKGERVDLSELTRQLALEGGFKEFAVTTRQGVNRRANKMGDEDLLFFRKPG